ncbi:nuclear transport factor 2 family protein [Pseudomaricurvus alkylphenolicus]|uniref:nuclear transport factor 2 family protein n=1 Tax=Pseudomaricurvus alkylphenolicus TaxID=1306991 RepID=UPI001422CAB9|nr:nuclear transport factor 2 family protein [Pseudomaricurvus alkylphenolicus]NIB38191.1 nuclear transport factor 2 family protein [Pseudomaricurvus alkylphenolicus]
MTTREELLGLSNEFVEAFNEQDMEKVLGLFADDGVFYHWDGSAHQGKDAIRECFKVMLDKKLAKTHFEETDVFADAETGKVTTAWNLTMSVQGAEKKVTGLDLLHWKDGKLVSKKTYAKTDAPK